jgi:hypothetical protein
MTRETIFALLKAPASPEYFPDNLNPAPPPPGKIRIPLLLRAVTGDRQTPLEGGVLLSLPRKDPANPGASFLPGDRLLLRSALKRFRSFINPAASIMCAIKPEKVSTLIVF